MFPELFQVLSNQTPKFQYFSVGDSFIGFFGADVVVGKYNFVLTYINISGLRV